MLIVTLDAYSQRAHIDTTSEYAKNKFIRAKNKYKYHKQKYLNVLKRKTIWEIDTNSVYVFQHEGKYKFIRFFSNGVMYESDLYLSEPKGDEFDDLNYGWLNMYTTKKGEVVEEQAIYSDYVRWHYVFGRIEGDKIIWYKYRLGRGIGGAKESFYSVYEKKKTKLYNHTVIWK